MWVGLSYYVRHPPMRERASPKHIHNAIAHREELGTVEGLSEEVRQIVSGSNEGDHHPSGLDDLPHVEVPPFDVLSLLVVLRIISEVNGRLVVHREGERRGRTLLELLEKVAEINGLLSGLRGSHNLRLA